MTIQEVGSGDTRVKPIKLGGALVTLVEPHRGHEVEYNRWYERDHFYAGCMIGAWTISGSRYVATAEHKALRFPDGLARRRRPRGRVLRRALLGPRRQVRRVDEVGHGPGQLAPRQRPHVPAPRPRPHHDVQVPRRRPRRRRRRAGGARARPRLPGSRPDDGGAARGQGRARGSSTGSRAGRRPRPTRWRRSPRCRSSPTRRPTCRSRPETERITLLFFDVSDPIDHWAGYETIARDLADAGGRVVYASPFVKTIPGTDTYTDKLW